MFSIMMRVWAGLKSIVARLKVKFAKICLKHLFRTITLFFLWLILIELKNNFILELLNFIYPTITLLKKLSWRAYHAIAYDALDIIIWITAELEIKVKFALLPFLTGCTREYKKFLTEYTGKYKFLTRYTGEHNFLPRYGRLLNLKEIYGGLYILNEIYWRL